MHTGGQVEPSAQLKAVPIVYKPSTPPTRRLFCLSSTSDWYRRPFMSRYNFYESFEHIYE